MVFLCITNTYDQCFGWVTARTSGLCYSSPEFSLWNKWEEETRGEPANPGSPGKQPLKWLRCQRKSRRKSIKQCSAAAVAALSIRTNPVHNFMAATFSLKLATFCEKGTLMWNLWFLVDFSAFSFICEDFWTFINTLLQRLFHLWCATLHCIAN